MYNDEFFRYLKNINLSKNRITEVSGLKPPLLTSLNLNSNNIDKLDTFEGHPKLKKLELRGNKISNLSTLNNMPELRELYLVIIFI